MAKLDLSLVLACYNEGPTFEDSLLKIEKTLNNTKLKWEAICIEDKGTDDTAKKLKIFTQKHKKFKGIYHSKNIGRGGTVAEGIKKAKGDVVGFIDVDLEVSAIYIPQFVDTIRNGADVAIATRIYKEEASSIPRFIASKAYVIIVRSMLGVNYKDTEAGYKFFNRKKILPVLKKIKDKRWFFDTEIVVRSSWEDLKIVEVPVLFIRRGDKQSTVRLFNDTLDYLKAIWEFKDEKEKIDNPNS